MGEVLSRPLRGLRFWVASVFHNPNKGTQGQFLKSSQWIKLDASAECFGEVSFQWTSGCWVTKSYHAMAWLPDCVSQSWQRRLDDCKLPAMQTAQSEKIRKRIGAKTLHMDMLHSKENSASSLVSNTGLPTLLGTAAQYLLLPKVCLRSEVHNIKSNKTPSSQNTRVCPSYGPSLQFFPESINLLLQRYNFAATELLNGA